MVHWYFDEKVAVERMREAQRHADRAQALGRVRSERPGAWRRLRGILGRMLVAMGKRLQQGEPIGRPDLASSSQCGLR
jgi:hypothetical protein